MPFEFILRYKNPCIAMAIRGFYALSESKIHHKIIYAITCNNRYNYKNGPVPHHRLATWAARHTSRNRKSLVSRRFDREAQAVIQH